ncbi:MAG: hypothetical protein KAS78_05125, partial [Candidatus Pacebacteria bacterium]|nr:hypothetical protein [Candidatus Paceibacterota bacterium]
NKIIILISILFLLILSEVVFTFQKNSQNEQDGKSLLEEFSSGNFKNIQVDNDDRVEYLKKYSSQTVFIDKIVNVNNDGNKKQKLSITQNLNFLAKIGKNLFGIKRATIFQPVNRVIELRENTKTSRIIKVPEDYKSIQSAIDNAKTGDTVKVAAGKYQENIIMKEGVSVIGAGFLKPESLDSLMAQDKEDTNEQTLSHIENKSVENENTNEKNIENEIQYDFSMDETASSIIDGNNYGNVVAFKNITANKTELAGFTIINSGKNLDGIFIENSSPWIHDNILVENEYNIYIKGESFPIIQKNIIRFANKGIQIYNFKKQDSSMQKNGTNNIKTILIDNIITDNKIGIDLYQSSAIINHNIISYNNHYKTYLGATYGIYLSKSSAEIKNNIITDSGICELCSGVSADTGSREVILKYNNIWNNNNNFVCFGECVMENNNLSEDPLFVDYINGDYKLSEKSGLIGKSEKDLDIGVRWE